MTTPAAAEPASDDASSTEASGGALARLRTGLHTFAAVRTALTDVSEVAELDTLTLRGHATVADLDLPVLLRLGAQGHTARLLVEDDDWSLTVTSSSDAQPSVDLVGEIDGSLTAETAGKLRQAVDDRAAQQALDAIAHRDCEVRVRLHNDPLSSGVHWCANEEALSRLLTPQRWPATAIALADGPAVLVVDGAGADFFVTHGPDHPRTGGHC